MKNNPQRRDRFLRVSEKRRKKAIEAIGAINSLSASHYKFEKEEIVNLFSSLYAALDKGWLTFTLKGVSEKEKLEFLFDREISQYEQIKKSDPALYAELRNNLSANVTAYIEKKENDSSSNKMSLDVLKDLEGVIHHKISDGLDKINGQMKELEYQLYRQTEKVSYLLEQTEKKLK